MQSLVADELLEIADNKILADPARRQLTPRLSTIQRLKWTLRFFMESIPEYVYFDRYEITRPTLHTEKILDFLGKPLKNKTERMINIITLGRSKEKTYS